MRSLHFQSGKHNLDMDGKRRYALSDWWLLGPPRGISVGASLKLWGRISKNTYHATEHLKHEDVNNENN